LNYLDIILLLLILIPAVGGYRNGFLKSLLSLVSIIVGIYLATRFHTGFRLVLSKLFTNPRAVDIVSFLLIIAITYFIGVFIANRLSKINKLTQILDKGLGLGLGFLKGVVVSSLLLIILTSISLFPQSVLKASVLQSYLLPVAPKVYDYVSTIVPINKKSFLDLNPYFQVDSLMKK